MFFVLNVFLYFLNSLFLYLPTTEWTQALTKYLREQLQKIIEHYQGSSGGSALAAAQSGFLTAAPTTIIDLDGALRQWNYGTQLAHYMYSEGLFDRHEFLSWIVELLEKVKITDDTVLKLVMAQVLKVSGFPFCSLYVNLIGLVSAYEILRRIAIAY